MDFNKFEEAFNKMNYDLKTKLKIKPFEASAFIVTESADLETASDFISFVLDSEDKQLISSIYVQESVSKLFIELLEKKVKSCEADEVVKKLSTSGFQVIGNRIVKCTRNLIFNEKSSAVSLEVFRTTKEAISLAKSSVSVSLWCEKLSIAFEYINAFSSQQIWLNSSFGTVHAKIPFLCKNAEVICDDDIKTLITDGGQKSALCEVKDNIQYQTTFQNGKFKTVVIPYGETFAN